MHRKQLASVCAIALSAGALFICGSASAAAQSPAASSTSVTRTPMAGGTVHLTDYQANDGVRSTVIVTGAIGDFGQAVSVYPSGKPDPEHNSELRLGLTRGSFRLRIAALDKKIVRAFRHFPPNMRTCSGNVVVKAATPIVAGSGTGAYRRISGSFHTTVMIGEVGAKKPKCSSPGPPLAEAIFVTGSGTVSFG